MFLKLLSQLRHDDAPEDRAETDRPVVVGKGRLSTIIVYRGQEIAAEHGRDISDVTDRFPDRHRGIGEGRR